MLRFHSSLAVPFDHSEAEREHSRSTPRITKVNQKISGGFRALQAAATFCTLRGDRSTARKQG